MNTWIVMLANGKHHVVHAEYCRIDNGDFGSMAPGSGSVEFHRRPKQPGVAGELAFAVAGGYWTSVMLVDSEAEQHGIDRLVASAVTRMKEGD